MEELTPQSIRRSRRALETHNLQIQDKSEEVLEEEVPIHEDGRAETEPDIGKGKRSVSEWKELLAFPSDEVLEKALESTTQL